MMQVLQKTSKVCEKKSSSSTDDDSDVEVVDIDTQREKAKSNKKGGTKGKELCVHSKSHFYSIDLVL